MTGTEAPDGGEALIRAAEDLGAEYIFCSSGSEWAPVWEAFARRREAGTPGPRYLDLAHETTAVGMATGYAAVTGRPQVVLLHAAAGLLQGANAIHGALLSCAPVVICSGESAGYGDAAGPDPGSQWYRNLSVVGGPQAMAAPFTKWACAAADVSVLYGMVKRAGEHAAQPPAGPVYVNTPVEVLLAPWQPSPADGPAPYLFRANSSVGMFSLPLNRVSSNSPNNALRRRRMTSRITSKVNGVITANIAAKMPHPKAFMSTSPVRQRTPS